MIKVWQRIIAIAEVLGGILALSATILAAKAGASKTAILLGLGLDLLVVVSGILLWFKPTIGIGLSEIVQGLQCVQIFSVWLTWQYVTGLALLVQVVGGEMGWSGGLLVRHTFSHDSSGSGLGVNLIAVAALTFLVMSQRRKESLRRRGSA